MKIMSKIKITQIGRNPHLKTFEKILGQILLFLILSKRGASPSKFRIKEDQSYYGFLFWGDGRKEL